MHGSIESLPPVFVSERDLRHLTALVDGHLCDRFPAETAALRSELDRALVIAEDGATDDVVAMHSSVEYMDCASGRLARVTLVFPWEADPASTRISILAPLATALLGLRVGARIEWSTPSGRSFVWQVLAVSKDGPAR